MKPFKIYLSGKPTNGVVFVFGGLWVHRRFYSLGTRIFNRRGLQVILFVPNPKLVSVGTPYQALIDASKTAEEYVAKVLQTVGPDATIISMGTSLGTAWAIEIAKNFKQVSRVMLMAPFGDFEDHVPRWTQQFHFRKILDSQPGSLEDSTRVLNQINPGQNLSALKGKDIMIGYATNDKFIHTAATKKLVADMQEAGLQVRVKVFRGGHYGGIFQTHNWMIRTRSEYL